MNTVATKMPTDVSAPGASSTDLLGLFESTPVAMGTSVGGNGVSDLDVLFTKYPELSRFSEISSDVFHPTQVIAAREILTKFDETRLALLLAQMQSGKTGTFLCVACAMVHYGMVENVIIFTSVPETDLFKQLSNSVAEAKEHFAAIFPDSPLVTKSDSISVIKSCELPRTTIPGGSLLIWDESHFAQDTNNRPFALFQNNGLLIDGSSTTNELWANKNCYLLTVSATPFSEYLDCVHTDTEEEITKAIVTLQPGASYRGVSHYLVNNSIQRSFNIFSKSGACQFTRLLQKHEVQGYPQYGILRVRNSKCAIDGLESFGSPSDIIRFLAMRRGWKVLFYDQKNKEQMPEGWDTLRTQPEQNTLIVLKDMGRVGQVVPKEYVAFVFEHVKSKTNTDTVLQSLLGRMCGYGPFNRNITVYINDTNFVESEVDMDSEMAHLRYKLESLKETAEKMYSHDEFAKETYFKVMSDKIREEHTEAVEYQRRSELERYIFMMERNTSDIPRFAKNIRSKKISTEHTGECGYSTIPFVIDVSEMEGTSAAGTDTNWTPLVAYATNEIKSRRVNFEQRRQIASAVLAQLERAMETRNIPFGDKLQAREVIYMLSQIIRENNCDTKINFGDLGCHSQKNLSLRMKTAVDSQTPYVDGASREDWLKQDKRIQIMVRNVGKVECEQGGVPLSRNSKHIYVTAVTYEAQDTTKDAHKKTQVPNTTGKEVFHIGHELCDDITYTWLNYISNNSDFHGFLEAIWPANKKITLLLSDEVSSSAIAQMDRLIAVRDGRFAVEKKQGRPSLEERKLGVIRRRYKIHFFEQSSLTTEVVV